MKISKNNIQNMNGYMNTYADNVQGNCMLCGRYCSNLPRSKNRFANSHSIPSSVIENLQNNSHKVALFHYQTSHLSRDYTALTKNTEVDYSQKVSSAGTFHNICSDCELPKKNIIKDRYEQYIGNDFYYEFTKKDIEDLYLKNLLLELYISESILYSISRVLQDTLYIEQYSNIVNQYYTQLEILNKLYKGYFNRQKNVFKSEIIWDSNVCFPQGLNLKFASLTTKHGGIVKDAKLHRTIFTIPYSKDQKSRVIITGALDPVSKILLFNNLQKCKTEKEITEKIVYLIFKEQFRRTIFPVSFSNFALLQNTTKYNQDDPALEKVIIPAIARSLEW